MTGTPQPGRDEPSGRGEQPPGHGYSGYTDPAYASQAYGPTYQPPPGPAPTQRLSPYGEYGYDPYGTGQYGAPYPNGEASPPPPPDEPRSPRWLWVAAGLAVLTVLGLVIALVVVNSSQQQTVVAPPPMQEPDFTTPIPTTTLRPTVPRTTRPTVPPAVPTVPGTPGAPGTTTPGATQSVVYVVSGSGRAINITYVDTGGLLQTEFNVMLPWSKEVELTESAAASASISIINVGREVNCSITVDGSVVQKRTGAGLTICTATG
nr:MmpS family transport accessory protein [Mycolicibacterium malmesburyense]CRL74724.1 mycobacterial membrane protein [Mycolicibacterium malmesburyense]